MTRWMAVAALCAWSVPALAQQPRDVMGGERAGTGSISGVITSDETPARPLRRARVMLNGTEMDVGRTAITQDDGSFVFDRLRPGRYTIAAAKDGYLNVSYGARRPNRPGPGVSLGRGEQLRISMQLPRGGVVTGTILDPEGLPAPGVRVIALAYQFLRGPDERRLMPMGTAAPQTTDDRGTFRIFGLPPGEYVIGALPHSALQSVADVQVLSQSELRRALAEVRSGPANARPGLASAPAPSPTGGAEKRRTVGMVPVYFPGTPMLARAAMVTLAAGEERTGLDFQLQYVPTTIVEGTVSFPPGATPGASVMLLVRQQGGPSEVTRTGRAGPDGRFSLRGVPPGEYTLIARTSIAQKPPAPPVPLVASTDIQIDGENAPEVFLTPQPGITISGSIVFEGASPLSGPLPPIRLNAPLLQAGTNAAFGMPPVQIDADGRFSVSGIPPGSYKMVANLQGVRAPIGRWWLKSFVAGGQDLLDTGLALRQSVSDAVLTFSTTTSALTGSVRDAAGNAATELTVIVFSSDKTTWFPNSRRIAAVKPGRDGRFTIRNLPPGDYFVVAEDDVEPGEWFDTIVLERLVPQATRLTLGADEQKTHDIAIPAR
jgi:uncharacterized protein (DUF2141 family)